MDILFKVNFIEWNDYSWYLHYDIDFIDIQKNKKYHLGRVLIVDPEIANEAYKNDEVYKYRNNLNNSFNLLPENFISLGVTKEYYENIYKYSLEIENFKKNIKDKLNDIVLNDSAEKFIDYTFYKESFTRHNTHFAITNTFKRVLEYGNEKYEYDLSFDYDWLDSCLHIRTKNEAILSDNVYGIIGKNGIGKTRLLNDTINKLIMNNKEDVNEVLFISMSSFDSHELLKNEKVDYISTLDIEEGNNLKSRNILIKEIYNQMEIIALNPEKSHDMTVLLETFENQFDQELLFVFEEIFEYANMNEGITDLPDYLEEKFKKFSSGQMYLFYIFIILTSKVEENMFAVIDEPELYLHPPYIMAYINLLNFIFEKRNAVALIATHSPIVIQQIPSECVYEIEEDFKNKKLLRKINFPCYGENLGIINDRIFDISISDSGFYKELRNKKFEDLEYIYRNNLIGIEAKIFIKKLINERKERL